MNILKPFFSISICSVLFFGCKNTIKELPKPSADEILQLNYINKSINKLQYVLSENPVLLALNRQSVRTSNNSTIALDTKDTDKIWYTLIEAVTLAQELKKSAKNSQHINDESVAEIIEIYAMMMLTDLYGAVPYLNTEDKEFQDVTDVYRLMNSRLTTIDFLNEGVNYVSQDILFNGDYSKWKKFANSLHLRLCLRMLSLEDGRTNNDGRVGISNILNNKRKYPLMQGIQDNASLELKDNDNIAVKDYIDYLSEKGDKRMSYLLSESENGFVGTNLTDENSQGTEGISKIKYNLVRLMSYQEQQLILAELALLGIAKGDVKQYYSESITADYEELGVDLGDYNPHEEFENFLNEEEKLKHIRQEKWISLQNNSVEGWTEYRRTKFMNFNLITELGEGEDKEMHRLPYPNELNNDDDVKSNAPNTNIWVDRLDFAKKL